MMKLISRQNSWISNKSVHYLCFILCQNRKRKSKSRPHLFANVGFFVCFLSGYWSLVNSFLAEIFAPLLNKGIFASKINNYLMFVEVCTSGPDPGLSVLAGGGGGSN